MNIPQMTTEQLEEHLSELRHQESYGASPWGQQTLRKIAAELQRRREMLEQCSEDCGDCNGCEGAA